jgi:hypothetical protein
MSDAGGPFDPSGKWWRTQVLPNSDTNPHTKQDCVRCTLRFRPVEREGAAMSPHVGWACTIECLRLALADHFDKDEETIK